MKKLFAVFLHSPNSEVGERIEEKYPINYRYTDNIYLICQDSPVVTQKVAETIGIRGENRIEDSSGVVFKLNDAYSGHTHRALWGWLNSVTGET